MSAPISQTALAAVLGVSKSTICVWTREGIIKAEIHIGKTYRYDPDKVKSQLSEHAKKEAAATGMATA